MLKVTECSFYDELRAVWHCHMAKVLLRSSLRCVQTFFAQLPHVALPLSSP